MPNPLIQRVPQGHERTPAGLIVPTDAIQRDRLVMSHDQQRLLDRTVKQVLAPMKMRHIPVCADPKCPAPEIKTRLEAHGFTLECGCTRREIHRTV